MLTEPPTKSTNNPHHSLPVEIRYVAEAMVTEMIRVKHTIIR